MKVVIIGGVAGGATAAARIRRLCESAQIVMFEKGEYISYANCGLPYYVGGVITDEDDLTLQTPQSFKKRYDVDVRVLSEVTAIDRGKKAVTVFDKISGSSYTESYDKLLIATGAEPINPGIEGTDDDRVFTVKTVADAFRVKNFAREEEPKSAIIIGGGYIGLEMAENLAALGTKVSIVEYSDHLLATLDYDAACDLHGYAVKMGVELYLNERAERIEREGETLKVITSGYTIQADMAILAAGVAADSKLARACGLALTDRGEIVVDENMRTSDGDIYAVGDAVAVTEIVSGKRRHIPLAGPANKQARVAADNICGKDSRYAGALGVAILKFFDMTVATCGLTENLAKAYGFEYEKSYTNSPSHATYYPGATYMAMKIIFEKGNGRLLGAQITGFEGVDKRIDVLATAIRAKMTIWQLCELDLAYAPPYSSAKDPVNIAGYAASNVLSGIVKTFHWHDPFPTDGSAELIDVRTEAEYKRGTIPGFRNIPLDTLRENLDKIDKTKPVYITCQIGLRGYVACRILTEHGYTCHNLSGGYRLYKSIQEDKINQKQKMT